MLIHCDVNTRFAVDHIRVWWLGVHAIRWTFIWLMPWWPMCWIKCRSLIHCLNHWAVACSVSLWIYLLLLLVQTCIWPSWCHCHSLSLASVKSRLVFTFLVLAHLGSPGKRAVKRVCVRMCWRGKQWWFSMFVCDVAFACRWRCKMSWYVHFHRQLMSMRLL